MKNILFDASLCNGCYSCQFACKDEHCGNDWSPIAAPQPMTGQFWCKMDQYERGKCPEVKVQYTLHMCGHCDNCSLLEYAPECVYRRDDGLIIIDSEKARGRKDIMEHCNEELLFWNEELELPQKCTGCAHLLDNGWEVPRCVEICPTQALRVVEDDELPENATNLPGQEGKGSHFFVVNIPKKWIYGCLVDREKNEVIIGATAKLTDASGAEVATLTTDEFGEFRFKELEDAEYQVTISADGYEDVTLAADTTQADVVLGDIFAKAA